MLNAKFVPNKNVIIYILTHIDKVNTNSTHSEILNTFGFIKYPIWQLKMLYMQLYIDYMGGPRAFA